MDLINWQLYVIQSMALTQHGACRCVLCIAWVCYDGPCNAAAAWSKRSWLWFKWMLLHFSFLTFTAGNRKCSLSTSAALCFTAVHEVTVDTFHRENNPPRIFFLFSPPPMFFPPGKSSSKLSHWKLVFSAPVPPSASRESVCVCVCNICFQQTQKRPSETLAVTHLFWWRSERSWPLGAVRAKEVREWCL